MYKKLARLIEEYEEELVSWRREVHKYAESAFLEMRTASRLARIFSEMGYQVILGEDACDLRKARWLPSKEALESRYQQAIDEGADPEFIIPMRNGNTAIIAELDCGEGPTVGMHCELDAVAVDESTCVEHRPFREGFASVHPLMMHACGHDGNQAVCLGMAKALAAIRNELHGKVKFIFKPADEKGQGACTILPKGHLDDVDYLFSTHIYEHKWFPDQPELNMMADFPVTYATWHFSVELHGKGCSSSIPQEGKNVALALATAVLNLQGIPRHGNGDTRINVGKILAGESTGTIPKNGYMEVGIMGQTHEVCNYMKDYAYSIIRNACEMHRIAYEIHERGGCIPITCDAELANRMVRVVRENIPDVVIGAKPGRVLNGADDYAYMQERVRAHGGLATDTQQITDVWGLPHGEMFDFNEDCLVKSAKALTAVFYDILKG